MGGKKKRAETDYDVDVTLPYNPGDLYWRAKTAIQYAEQKDVGIACKVLLDVLDKYEWNAYMGHMTNGLLSSLSEVYGAMRKVVEGVQSRVSGEKKAGFFERKKLRRRVKKLALELMLEDFSMDFSDRQAFAEEYSQKSYIEISTAFENPGRDMSLWSLVKNGRD